ncbi:SMP-30/gluconolactonase/LRE family protein [Agrobacterium rhizogenes]|uniref:SMP-30/gluconolactonase/LRE family protein n=1 Tax=Rhizobium rhizogenes TaxID=359 RepID=UPI0022B698AF|nr:SMP-30/gluconolactonase/LRE family protein [Rhizobium rhizogenes]MCZ7447272.1 SMP-30/gluconolactonase/LRE family protein [Rhizobium rhizogenes]
MFAAPPDVKAEVFARLPDNLRKQGSASAWLEKHNRGRPRHSLLEGPSFDANGALYLVDTAFGRVFKISPEGAFSVVAEYDGQPNGLKIHRDGRIFIADHIRGLLQLDPGRGAVSTICEEGPDRPFHGLNDLFFAGNGDLYMTDQGQTGLQDPNGRVYKLTAAGRLELVMAGIPSPNGIVMNSEETCLYVAVTRDNAIWRLPLMLDGTVSKVGAFIRLSGGIGPDGLALDRQDGLAIAHIGLGCVWMIDRRGEPCLRVRLPEGNSPTNVAFGGRNFRSLFITEADSGTVFVVRDAGVQGHKMFSHPQD